MEPREGLACALQCSSQMGAGRESLILIAHTIQTLTFVQALQNKPAKREACDENERAMDLDAKQGTIGGEDAFCGIILIQLFHVYGALQIGRCSTIRERKADERRNTEEGR